MEPPLDDITLFQFTAKSNWYFSLMIVIYGSNEKHQRRHSTMVYVRGWSLVVSGFFPFFLFFFICFFYGSHHTNKHAFRVGMRNVSVLTCPEWYMLWTIPGYQPLPSLNYHHHQQKNDPNSKSNFNKKKWMMRQWQPKIIIMPMWGGDEHPYTHHP